MNKVEKSVDRQIDILKLAASDVRLKIIYLLSTEEHLCPCDLSDILDMSVPAVSQYLCKLKDGRLVETERDGQTIFYSLNPSFNEILSPSFNQIKDNNILEVLAALLLAFPYYSDAFLPNQQNQKIVYIQESQVQTITLDIEGMTCTGCEATVKNAASGVRGVLEADASYDTGQATIKYDQSKTNQEVIVTAINKTGFTVAEKQAN